MESVGDEDMASLSSLRVKHYTAEHIPNSYPKGDLPWQVYHEVRNAVVRTCRRHGPTGPLGVRPLDLDDLESAKAWEFGDKDPLYWVIDDQYNNERYLYLEPQAGTAFTPEWLEDITETLAQYPGWGIGVVSLAKGYLLIFADCLMVQGPGFQGCKTAASVLAAARKLV
jgi:hypothetical protein